jgi:beta-lactamase class D
MILQETSGCPVIPQKQHKVQPVGFISNWQRVLARIHGPRENWTRQAGINTGWWIGWMETKKGVYFFATRLLQPRTNNRTDFGSCRKMITMAMLKKFGAH